jgi:hypothetical protein
MSPSKLSIDKAPGSTSFSFRKIVSTLSLYNFKSGMVSSVFLQEKVDKTTITTKIDEAIIEIVFFLT